MIEVADLETARQEYALLLGRPLADNRIRLANVDIQLIASAHRASAAISGLQLRDETLAAGDVIAVDTGDRQLTLERSHCRGTTYRDCQTPTGLYAVDHVVLQSRDADDCIRLFREQLGLRLALDQQVPEWGGRMLFFRHGKMTLEVIHNLEKPPAEDFFWGITYLCRDIDATIAILDEHRIAHSPIRKGRKPGTRVATLKSHCLGLPTLVIGPA